MMRRLLRSWHSRVVVAGHSMEPTLRDGDWLLVDPRAYHARAAGVGQLVVAQDPRFPDRWLVKRVAALEPDDSLTLAGDHAAHASEGGLPSVPRSAVVGRPWLRYWPPSRLGRIR